MCRLLFISSKNEVNTSEHLKTFAEICNNSKEYQGHGWGCSYLINNEWIHYKNINPIWDDDLSNFPSSKRLIAHARSAFKDKDIVIENNMPFSDDNYLFVFNGELHGVRLKADGRIGAEKIFNFILRINKNDIESAIKKSVSIIKKRSKYIRAMNFIIADKKHAYISSFFEEDPEYFTLWLKKDDEKIIVCSNSYPQEEGWKPISNNLIGEIE